jgi:pSer/pThr/pTyr-binding forkhead associated (FHA) protein
LEKEGAEAPELETETVYAESPPEVTEKKQPLASLELDDETDFPLGSITTIGKGEECDIRLAGMLVARRHAVIIRGRGIYKLIRKGGLSSVRVNGEKVNEHVLKHGDLIEVGNHTMIFKVGEQ